ncbi:MAG TPA: beta-galactosidase [Chloroflexia bacterium]|nr:beta-galactosidase [Chloroflexia bacterium]
MRGKQHTIILRVNEFLIDDEPKLLLCSSLFYFRIPRGEWQSRLRRVKAAGYNCIDVYFPWNYHELGRDEWDFSNERDVSEFLHLAAEEGLWVIARPGPYICSEWDGGGLPAYLLLQREMHLRDNDPLFLAAVRTWYARIMAILQHFQWGQAGTVIALQLENELDFYDCNDPAGYISVLRDMAWEYGVTVPLIACTGQGDIARATGNVAGVLPSCNFYPGDKDPAFETKVLDYQARLQGLDLPLCVTETNRSHFLLRRLLACGVKLLGPYLQTSGTNFGFTTAINNWGNPMAFMTSDYDFQGMLSAAGEKRIEYSEARLLGQFITALGPSLAAATPLQNSGISLETGLRLADNAPGTLALRDGGYALALANLDESEGTITLQFGTENFPKYSTLQLQPGRCPFVLYAVPLSSWGWGEGYLRYATAELSIACSAESGGIMLFHTEAVGEISFTFPDGAKVETNTLTVHRENHNITFCFSAAQPGQATIRLANGQNLQIIGLAREQAGRVIAVSAEGQLIMDDSFVDYKVPVVTRFQPEWKAGRATNLVTEPVFLGTRPKYLEEVGIFKGIGWYEACLRADRATPVQGILLQSASDVVSVYVSQTYLGTFTPGGGSVYVPLPHHNPGPEINLRLRAEIWGHCNFDDSRLPSLRLNSLKGLGGVVGVMHDRDISQNWHFCPVDQPATAIVARQQNFDDANLPLMHFAGHQSTRQPNRGYYRRRFRPSPQADSWILHFSRAQARIQLFINEHDCGLVNPFNPYLDITPYVQPGEEVLVAAYVETLYGQEVGKVSLLEGQQATDWWVAAISEEVQLWKNVGQAWSKTTSITLPHRLAAGEMGWLFGELPPSVKHGWFVRCIGRNLKITALFNGHLVGRLWLPGPSRPQFKGGNPEIFYVPHAWFQTVENRLGLLLEAIEHDEASELIALDFQPVLSA